MTSSHVGVATDGPGKKIATSELTSDEVGAPIVERQEIVIADPTTIGNRQGVDSSGNAQVKINAPLPAGTNALGSVAVTSLPGSPAQEGTDGTGIAQPTGGAGIRGWLSGIYNRLGGTLATSRTWTLGSGTDSVNVGNFPATQPVSGTVTSNAGSGTFATSAADGSSVTLGTTTDASSASTLVGLLKAIKAAVQGTLAVSVSGIPTVTANAGTGTFKTAQQGGATLTSAQVSVTTTATQIIASNANRYSVVLKNTGASAAFLGTSGVAINTGHYLGPNESISFRSTAAIYGIVASGSVTVTTLEEAI